MYRRCIGDVWEMYGRCIGDVGRWGPVRAPLLSRARPLLEEGQAPHEGVRAFDGRRRAAFALATRSIEAWSKWPGTRPTSYTLSERVYVSYKACAAVQLWRRFLVVLHAMWACVLLNDNKHITRAHAACDNTLNSPTVLSDAALLHGYGKAINRGPRPGCW